MVYKFVIPGHPISKSNFKPKGSGGSAEARKRNADLKVYEATIEWEVKKQMRENGWEPLEGHIQVFIVLHKKWDKGDTQNYQKSICDGLEKALYVNDSCIKLISTLDGGVNKDNPHILIMARPMEKFDYIQCGSLVYNVPKDGNKHLNIKEIKKKKVKDLCSICGEEIVEERVLFEKKYKICKKNHGIPVP